MEAPAFTQISLFNTILAIGKLWFTLLLVPAYFSTSMAKHRVLIIGHCFVHRLAAFVQKKRHMFAFTSLSDIADIHFYGVGGRTIGKFRRFDLEVVRQIAPKVIILELGSNDLVKLAPETVGSELENLVRDLHDVHSVEIVVVGQVLRRRTRVHQFLKVVLEQLPFCYYWRYRGFWNCKRDLYLPDGVHLNNLI